jgi:hypothetical protein
MSTDHASPGQVAVSLDIGAGPEVVWGLVSDLPRTLKAAAEARAASA